MHRTYQNWKKLNDVEVSYIKIYKCHDSNQTKLFSAKNKDAKRNFTSLIKTLVVVDDYRKNLNSLLLFK